MNNVDNSLLDKFNKINLVSKQDLLMKSLTNFFRININIDKILPVINGESNISLRILDWFVTNYSKKNNIIYDVKTSNNEIKQFMVHLDYKSQLKAYSKKQFDPFCRRERLTFIDQYNNEIITTAGQLNFFRWAIENNVIDYIQKNISVIENDMNQSIRYLYKNNKPEIDKFGNKKRRKRKELSISATKSVSKHNVKITVKFE
jgi:hypothetical protein